MWQPDSSTNSISYSKTCAVELMNCSSSAAGRMAPTGRTGFARNRSFYFRQNSR